LKKNSHNESITNLPKGVGCHPRKFINAIVHCFKVTLAGTERDKRELFLQQLRDNYHLRARVANLTQQRKEEYHAKRM